jgi:phytoene dehydrogenase-like protein
MKSTPRTIVIGGGMAGLAAAAYLARDGMPTTLVERSASLGGRAQSDTTDGFALNRGAHALYTGGAASSVFADLGVTYTAGIPRGVLARDANGLHVLPATALDLLRTDLLDAADKAELMSVLVRLGMLRAARLAHTSTASWIAQNAHRPRVRQLLESIARVSLYTAALDLASADVFVDRFQQTLKHPVHYVDGGWQTLVDGLRRAAVASGVEVLSASGVAEVQLEASRVKGVRLHDGRLLECSSLVIAAPPEDVLHILPETAAPRTHRALAELQPVHVACLDLALQRLPVPRHAVIFDVEQPRFLTAQSEFARVAPDGGAVVHLFVHLDPRQPGEPARQRAAAEALMDEVQPGWRESAVEQRFLPRMLASGALPLASSAGMPGRPAHRCPDVDNVYFAGDWVGPEGYLADAALASARASAQLVLASRAEFALVAA